MLSAPIEDVRDQIIIAAHHPDCLHRPPLHAGALPDARLEQAFVWNVFRSLELLPPAFWLRRLHARLGAQTFPPAPQIVRVHLWKPLALPPAQRIDGARANVVADVTIDTEHAVWTLMLAGDRDTPLLNGDIGEGDPIARVIDAAAWRAGVRKHYFGIVEPCTSTTSVGGVLRRRYSRSRSSVEVRSGVRWTAAPVLGFVGILEWADLTAVMRDCAEAQVFSDIERALARNVVAWLEQCHS
jgi:hypothetical protein